ncbi:TetR/AcrR family transcriptional regulator [Rapidithrix thailandica]|uniref:TetR/AcrR family transcriptional regulator n=1 Tax=Rapidithrix thailandica TaxID=413964 RepID=A0AAW9RXQ4_9BACT
MAKKSNPEERLIQTAGRLFYHQGYNSTGINQVLEEAKVAKASLYKHFGSKEKLGLVYLQKARVEWFNGLDKATAKEEKALQKVLACFDFLEKNMKETNYLGCKFINMLSELAEAESEMREQIIAHKARLRSYIGDLVREACIQKHNPKGEVLADTVYLLFEGAIVESKIVKDTWPIEAARNSVKFLIGS